jgi:hypothetical protein
VAAPAEVRVRAVPDVTFPDAGENVGLAAVQVKAVDVFTAESVPPVPPHPIALRVADFVTEGLLDPSYLSPVVQVAPSAAQTGAVPVKV